MGEEHNLVLILARGLASSIATPMFIIDTGGTLVYYNEPAESILGRTYAEAGSLSQQEWGGALFDPREPTTGEPIAMESLPLSVALADRRPAYRAMAITGLDGVKRTISVTAFPLFARADEFVGAVAIFWEDRETS